jgi:hypothetical protein
MNTRFPTEKAVGDPFLAYQTCAREMLCLATIQNAPGAVHF